MCIYCTMYSHLCTITIVYIKLFQGQHIFITMTPNLRLTWCLCLSPHYCAHVTPSHHYPILAGNTNGAFSETSQSWKDPGGVWPSICSCTQTLTNFLFSPTRCLSGIHWAASVSLPKFYETTKKCYIVYYCICYSSCHLLCFLGALKISVCILYCVSIHHFWQLWEAVNQN